MFKIGGKIMCFLFKIGGNFLKILNDIGGNFLFTRFLGWGNIMI